MQRRRLEGRSARREGRPTNVRQLTFARRGGKRPGAGRKPKGDQPLVAHDRRPVLSGRTPALVTLKLMKGLPNLRRSGERALLFDAFRAGRERHGLRLVHFSIQSNHIHAVVEARDTQALSRGVLGLCVRIARALNRAWQRKGRVFADRFHARALRSPREVRYALAYTLNNARKHGLRVEGIDPYSSGAAFDGWREVRAAAGVCESLPVLRARAWLLTIGWRRHGLIRVTEIPGGST